MKQAETTASAAPRRGRRRRLLERRFHGPPEAPKVPHAATFHGLAVAGSVALAAARGPAVRRDDRLVRFLTSAKDIRSAAQDASKRSQLMGMPAARVGDMHVCPMSPSGAACRGPDSSSRIPDGPDWRMPARVSATCASASGRPTSSSLDPSP